MHRRPRTRAEGFTLVEVMVAVLLTAIAMIGILALFMSQSRASSYSRHMTEASVLASDGIEILRTETPPPATRTEANITEQGAAGGRFTRVSTTAAMGPTGEQFDLRVQVSWDEDGDTKTILVYGRR